MNMNALTVLLLPKMQAYGLMERLVTYRGETLGSCGPGRIFVVLKQHCAQQPGRGAQHEYACTSERCPVHSLLLPASNTSSSLAQLHL